MDNLTSRKPAAHAAVMPNVVPHDALPSFTTIRNDFIPHPQEFPLEVKKIRARDRNVRAQQPPGGDLGLSFVSRKYIPAGTEIEISIPLRGDVQRFHGSVVMVREIVGGYEIGLWLATADEASRARLVEQICHTECYLQDRHLRQHGRPVEPFVRRPEAKRSFGLAGRALPRLTN